MPPLRPGEVFNGEFTLSNYGLVDADTLTAELPASIGDHEIEILTELPEKLGAQKSITVAYRVTRRAATGTATYSYDSAASPTHKSLDLFVKLFYYLPLSIICNLY